MVAIAIFVASVLIQMLNDWILKGLLEHSSVVSLMFANNIISFLIIFIWKRKLIFSPQMILRGFLTFFALYLTNSVFETLSMLEIASMYYSIAVFIFIISWITRKEKVEVSTFLFFAFAVSVIILNGRNIPISGFIGCFCLAVLDIITKDYLAKDIIADVGSLCFFVAVMSCFFSRGIPFSGFSPEIFVIAVLSTIAQVLLFYALEKERLQNLIPFRFTDLVLIMIIKQENLYQAGILIVFMLFQLTRSILEKKEKKQLVHN